MFSTGLFGKWRFNAKFICFFSCEFSFHSASAIKTHSTLSCWGGIASTGTPFVGSAKFSFTAKSLISCAWRIWRMFLYSFCLLWHLMASKVRCFEQNSSGNLFWASTLIFLQSFLTNSTSMWNQSPPMEHVWFIWWPQTFWVTFSSTFIVVFNGVFTITATITTTTRVHSASRSFCG